MILVRSPLRLTLGGGGTDFPAYFTEHGGLCVTAAIDKYVYVSVSEPFEKGIFLRYRQVEHVETVDQVQHPILREALRLYDIDNIEITSHADVPAGTGLGSSSAFTAALVTALRQYRRRSWSKEGTAEAACEVEVHRAGSPIGYQDQYASAYGGVNRLRFGSDGVVVDSINISSTTEHTLTDHLLLFFTGYARQEHLALQRLQHRLDTHDAALLDYLHAYKGMAATMADALEHASWGALGPLLHDQWLAKLERDPDSVPHLIQRLYWAGRVAGGAHGGKLIGAGSGGFLLFYTEDPARLRATMTKCGLRELRFRVDWLGTQGVAL